MSTGLLPEHLRLALMRAASLPDPMDRLREIARVTDQARRLHPEHFRPEAESCEPSQSTTEASSSGRTIIGPS